MHVGIKGYVADRGTFLRLRCAVLSAPVLTPLAKGMGVMSLEAWMGLWRASNSC